MSDGRWKRLTARLPFADHDRALPLAPMSSDDLHGVPPEDAPDDPFLAERGDMVLRQLSAPGRDIRDARVLDAMARVPRHEFVPRACRAEAYADRPLPIGFEQTISQPFIVAFMTEAIHPASGDRVLEVGTGSGYQTAVLSRLVAEVHTVEIVPQLARAAAATFRHLGIDNVVVHEADGSRGWPDAAPYDAIVVTCAPRSIPAALFDQLREGGRLIAPIGDISEGQELRLVRKLPTGIESRRLISVRFVPMTGATRRDCDRE